MLIRLMIIWILNKWLHLLHSQNLLHLSTNIYILSTTLTYSLWKLRVLYSLWQKTSNFDADSQKWINVSIFIFINVWVYVNPSRFIYSYSFCCWNCSTCRKVNNTHVQPREKTFIETDRWFHKMDSDYVNAHWNFHVKCSQVEHLIVSKHSMCKCELFGYLLLKHLCHISLFPPAVSQSKTQYMLLYSIPDTSIKRTISQQSTPMLKGCIYTCLIK